MARYTHFKKLSGKDGLYTGSSTAGETRLASAGVLYVGTGTANYKFADASGIYKGSTEVNIASKEVIVCALLGMSATSTQSWYTVAPVAGNLVSGYMVHNVAAATTNIVSISHGSAGDNLAATVAEAGTVGTVSAFAMSATVAVTAGECLKLTITAAATSVQQTAFGLTFVFDKT